MKSRLQAKEGDFKWVGYQKASYPNVRPTWQLGWWLACCIFLGFSGAISAVSAQGLKDELGRNETRIYGASYKIEVGTSLGGAGLLERLERLRYLRVHARPTQIGEYFWGTRTFWIFRRPFRSGSEQFDAALLGLELDQRSNKILHLKPADGDPKAGPGIYRLEPELLAESLSPNRAVRIEVSFAALPDHVWRPVLAAEDARFFDHKGVDARSVARAALANFRSGSAAQGGSTITQQLIKVRDLSPQRTVGRKVSEAVRALFVEAKYDKEEILESYLNSIYFGHHEAAELWGIGTAAEAFYSKPAHRLSLKEAAVLAAIIQAPNRYSPARNMEALEGRWRWVLTRLKDLGWVDAKEIEESIAGGLPPLQLQNSRLPLAPHFLGWVGLQLAGPRPTNAMVPRGAVLETTLDLQLQREAESAVSAGLGRIRSNLSVLRGNDLSAALIAVNSKSGDVLAYVGGDPQRHGDGFDRVRQAHRQPGSAIKPLLLLEAFESCGKRSPLYPAHRITDEAVQIDLPSGTWEPRNSDNRFRGTVTLRQALIASLNIPFVRLADWCGFDATAKRVRRAGIHLPEDAKTIPASFVLGSVEASPLELLTAYTAIGALGNRIEPRSMTYIRLPSGRLVKKVRSSHTRIVGRPAAYLIRDMLEDVVSDGTAKAAGLEGVDLWGKTGTSSQGRDAWMVGGFGDYVAVVWVGLDAGAPVGLTGAGTAIPIWRQFIHKAVVQYPTDKPVRPRGIVEKLVIEASGLLASKTGPGVRPEIFRRGYLPKQKRFWRRNRPTEVIE